MPPLLPHAAPARARGSQAPPASPDRPSDPRNLPSPQHLYAGSGCGLGSRQRCRPRAMLRACRLSGSCVPLTELSPGTPPVPAASCLAPLHTPNSTLQPPPPHPPPPVLPDLRRLLGGVGDGLLRHRRRRVPALVRLAHREGWGEVVEGVGTWGAAVREAQAVARQTTKRPSPGPPAFLHSQQLPLALGGPQRACCGPPPRLQPLGQLHGVPELQWDVHWLQCLHGEAGLVGPLHAVHAAQACARPYAGGAPPPPRARPSLCCAAAREGLAAPVVPSLVKP